MLRPPLAPMLGRLARELPRAGHVFEPKWDGFRCLVFRDGDEVDLRSRHGRPFARYFPELVAALREVPRERFVLDGEVLVTVGGEFDFAALMLRLHPAASRVERLAAETPALFVAFDLLAEGDQDLLAVPFRLRRARLERLLAGPPPPLHLTPQTADVGLAERWLRDFGGGGVDGVVARAVDGVYEPGARRLVKVKRERTADCVVAGVRGSDEPEPQITSLLLGLYDGDDLRHVGVAASFGRARGRQFLEELRGEVVPLEGHPWERGFLLEGGPTGRLKGAAGRWEPGMSMDWIPIAPDRVCEVAYEQVDEGRLRHPGRFRRWRPDREPRSCGFEQLEVAAPEPAALLGAGA